MEKILVTGINGFVGKHLVRELAGRGSTVLGVGREPQLDPSIAPLVADYFVCDLTDTAGVAALPLDDVDGVISLAGLANVGASFDNPEVYNQINVQVFSVIASRLLALGSAARIIAVSTGAVYGADQPMPLTEDSTLITTGSPYALSKIAMEKEAKAMSDRGLDCVLVRPFNHIGPGQEPGFLLPDLYQKIKQAGKSDGMLPVGDLTTKRDYTDVRDVVRAYADLVMAPGKLDYAVYNVCSGRSVAGRQILDLLLKACRQEGKIDAKQDPALIRPNDPKDLYGSNQRLHAQTGWQPAIPLEQTINDFVAANP